MPERDPRFPGEAATQLTVSRKAQCRASYQLLALDVCRDGKPLNTFPRYRERQVALNTTVMPRREGLAISTTLTGSLRAGGQLGNGPGGLQDLLGNLLGGDSPTRTKPDQSEPSPDQRADIRGSATIIAAPTLLPQWRLEPNLKSEVTVQDASLSFLGMNLSVPEAVKPLLEDSINEQVASLQSWLHDDPLLELAARQEWAKMCRSIFLRAAEPDMPNLWLEIRPTRAFAAQPGLNQTAVTLTIGVQADTRVVPNETKPDCPFPERLDIADHMQQGQFNIALPIDIPFTEVNRLMEAQLKGKSFPEDESGAFTATIQGVKFAASGDRLLISVRLRAKETKTWFGFGADATIYVWGCPVLDRARQTLRLKDIALDVQSEAAFGMLGAAAHAVVPYLQNALEKNAVVDLVPVAQNARRNIDVEVAEFRKASDEIQVDAAIKELRLVDLAFDTNTLRVTAEADGTVRATVMKLNDVSAP